MLRASWSAASALVVALCTFGNTGAEACDWGCGGCAGYGYGGYGGYGGYAGYGYGGYGYAAAAYSPYSAYAYYAPPLYYQPAYAYYAPPPYYGYAAPAYGAGYYAPSVYGASYHAPSYGRPYYLGARNVHAPAVDGRAPAMIAAAQNGRRATAPRTWLSKTAPVTTATTTSPLAKSPATRPLGYSAIAAQPRPALKNIEKNTARGARKIPGPTLTAKPAVAPSIRRADAGLVR